MVVVAEKDDVDAVGSGLLVAVSDGVAVTFSRMWRRQHAASVKVLSELCLLVCIHVVPLAPAVFTDGSFLLPLHVS
jgi:hypothetical protein